MGYEVTYHYKEEIEKGSYSEEVKTKSTKIGSPYEEIPIEAVAGKIISQLARRNILIVDVEIYEFEKKKISYKEAEDGIVIKHKKFRFDDGPTLATDVVETPQQSLPEQLAALLAANPNLLNQLQQQKNGNIQTSTNKRILRYEVFDPDERSLIESKRKGHALTKGQRYAILEEKMTGSPPLTRTYYTVRDNHGQEISDVNAEYFTAALRTALSGPGDTTISKESEGDGLSWYGATVQPEDQMGMPNLRK